MKAAFHFILPAFLLPVLCPGLSAFGVLLRAAVRGSLAYAFAYLLVRFYACYFELL